MALSLLILLSLQFQQKQYQVKKNQFKQPIVFISQAVNEKEGNPLVLV